MAGKLLSENELGKRFFAGIIVDNFLAQIGFWGYKYWSGQEYSRQQRTEEHWEEVYMRVMQSPNCFGGLHPSSNLLGRTVILECRGLIKNENRFRIDMQGLSPNYTFKTLPKPNLHGFYFEENKAAILTPNSYGISVLIEHYADAK